jgi:HAMP domain-containing protein
MDPAIPADAAAIFLDFAQALERGDFTRRLPADLPGVAGQIATALNAHAQTLQAYASESCRVVNEIGVIGRLGPQAEVPDPRGSWHLMVQSLNFLAASLTSQVRNMSRTVDALAAGDYAARVTDTSMWGEHETFRARINALAEQLEQRHALAEVAR